MSDPDILTQIYNLISESLPAQHLPDYAAQAFMDSLTPEQTKLFNDYYLEESIREDEERLCLFRRLVHLGLYIPGC